MSIEQAAIHARNHLSAALAQSIESDDQIIMQHVRDAYALLGGRLEHLSAQQQHLHEIGEDEARLEWQDRECFPSPRDEEDEENMGCDCTNFYSAEEWRKKQDA